MKRILTLSLAAMFGAAVWYGALGLWVVPQQAFAQAVSPLPESYGSYSLSYFDVATAFVPSTGGYGGPGDSGGTGDALLRIVNAGNFETPDGITMMADSVLDSEQLGAVCANIYVFNDVQELQECCSCPLTPNSLMTFSVINDLTSNSLNLQESLSAGVIKILGSKPADPTHCNNTPGAVTAAAPFGAPAEGLHAWLNHTETMASNQAGFTPPYGFVTSTSVDEFAHTDLDRGEARFLFAGCAAINAADHTGTQAIGICKCGLGD
jgi:hypothetical protein